MAYLIEAALHVALASLNWPPFLYRKLPAWFTKLSYCIILIRRNCWFHFLPILASWTKIFWARRHEIFHQAKFSYCPICSCLASTTSLANLIYFSFDYYLILVLDKLTENFLIGEITENVSGTFTKIFHSNFWAFSGIKNLGW